MNKVIQLRDPNQVGRNMHDYGQPGGTFSVSRKIWGHPEFAVSEFSEREAFLWLVSEASWRDRTVRSGNLVIDLSRGQMTASVRFMAEAWGWSKSRVSRFLKRLENRDMLRTESGTGQLVVTVCNYNEYQPSLDCSGTAAGQQAGQQRDSSGTNYNKGNKGNKEVTPKPPFRGHERFQEFWDAYGHKVGLGAAEKAFDRAAKIEDPATIISAAREFSKSRSGAEPRFTPHPATWLNGKRWADAAPTKSSATIRGGRRGEMTSMGWIPDVE